uniref:Uncharacterized protein n=1 Tax=Geospiza parvula TaxID=87175 RepID=A0A8U8B158_GEOPR
SAGPLREKPANKDRRGNACAGGQRGARVPSGAADPASPEYYPHQPFRWVMRHLTDGKTLRDITTPNTPSFILRVADLFPGQPKPDPHSPHATHMYLSYWCPASNPGKSYCNSPGWGYCGHSGCETIVTDARPSGPGWDPQEPDKFLQFTWAPAGCKTPVFIQGNFYRNHYKIPKIRKCTHYNMTVLQPNHPGWTVGKVWTAVLQGSKQWVNVQITRLQPSAPRAVGPNKVIRSTQKGRNMTYPKALPTKVTDVPTGGMETFQIGRSTGSESDPILSMLEATFLSLNESNPNLTNSCWLCYDVKPPFYEGVALDIPFSYSTAKKECCFYREREAQQGWFESWFNQSPWLTTLISTLAGPLAMLLLEELLTLLLSPADRQK